MTPPLPLHGVSVLITRAQHQAGSFARAIENLGGSAIALPTIEIQPPGSWNDCDNAIDNLYMYDGLIFTSTNGVEFFFHRLEERSADTSSLTTKKIFVVGERTKQAVESRGLTVTSMPEKFTAQDLAQKISQEDLHDRAFLFPRGNLGKDTLQDNLKILGAVVDAVSVYRTVRPTGALAEQLRGLLLSGRIDVATFTSPSTFRNLVDLFSPEESQRIKSMLVIAAIGPVTAGSIRSAGFEVHIQAPESTTEAMAEAIARYIARHPTAHSTPAS